MGEAAKVPTFGVSDIQAKVEPAAAPAQPEPAATPAQPTAVETSPGQAPYGQAPNGQAPYGQAPWAAMAGPAEVRQPSLDRRRLMPTVAVACIVAAVVLGGLGLDKALAAPSAGKVAVGNHVTIVAAPGWVRADEGGANGSAGVTLQQANAQLSVQALSYGGSAGAALSDLESSVSSEADQVSFGDEQDGTISGRKVAMAGFEAVVSGSSGSGTVDGELICMIASGNAVVFEVVAAQGDLGTVVDDVKAMVSSVEVGQ
jgi:hypothetical protein